MSDISPRVADSVPRDTDLADASPITVLFGNRELTSHQKSISESARVQGLSMYPMNERHPCDACPWLN